MIIPQFPGVRAPRAWRALIAEDEPIIAASIEDCLALLGAAEIVFARTLDEAYAAIVPGAFAIAVVDWHLGATTAGALVRRLIDCGAVPIVVTGAHKSELSGLDAEVEVLGKPFRDSGLNAALTRALARVASG